MLLTFFCAIAFKLRSVWGNYSEDERICSKNLLFCTCMDGRVKLSKKLGQKVWNWWGGKVIGWGQGVNTIKERCNFYFFKASGHEYRQSEDLQESSHENWEKRAEERWLLEMILELKNCYSAQWFCEEALKEDILTLKKLSSLSSCTCNLDIMKILKFKYYVKRWKPEVTQCSTQLLGNPDLLIAQLLTLMMVDFKSTF